MKAKEDKIREDWNKIGVNFPIGVCMKTGYSEVQNENDVSKILEYHNISVTDIEWQHINPAGLRYRPKSLQGIENNNGWHCISEKDFPEDELTVLWYNKENGEFENASLLHFDFDFKDYTHWHLLPPQPPLY